MIRVVKTPRRLWLRFQISYTRVYVKDLLVPLSFPENLSCNFLIEDIPYIRHKTKDHVAYLAAHLFVERAGGLGPVVQKCGYAIALACAELRIGAVVQLPVVVITLSAA